MISKSYTIFGLLVILSACVTANAPSGQFMEEDGFFIQSFADGSAGVNVGRDVLDFGWSIDCRADAMSDRRKCSFFPHNGGLDVEYGTSTQPKEICVTNHNFPGRRAMIRVDQNAPVTTNTSGCAPIGSLLTQLKTGSVVTVRRYEWPYDYPQDKSHTLSGFSKAMQVVDRIRAGTMPITN